ncbi:GNAT family N-acetyltransferase [Legionella pneumophila]|uniref:GNAT family N-acetyltransferase n=1 Tax=Legionella pneumophila TaxID=446 RepID=UPI000770AD74|nr:GNAT family N-acetyltransferase [Legionella pneumophila]HAT9685441.1 GNAT family N-acetyltransferase [Legionella pneumophila subsp. pneumophila]CZH12578.1 ribosomal-protein-alanine acetyltransferase [Legionella pneumophila]CZH43304.1 ribosomal-protein-alanine acetyltransferase [Legionella pneumophila]CZH46995.1 ribosomal-protein-alanine acetyltransferase [Legionella pneumophila]HAT8609216.1 GNAT family N-acetyltransferase [Legionella pneumophila]
MNQSQMNYQLDLVIDTKLLEQQDKIIRDGIVNFNAPFTGTKPERYSIYAKDSEGNIIGGAIVYAHINSVYVDVLWVSEEYRGLGIGAGLLRSVETEAIKRGIPASTLDTFSFQAEGFYLKQGYQHLGTIKNYLEGHDRIYFRKQL